MESRKIVYRETAVVAIGETLCVGLMFVIFALLGQWSQGVLLGGIFGFLLSVGNFFFMALCTCLAADRAEAQNVKGGQALLRVSYFTRFAVMAVVLFAGAKSGLCNILALALPLLFPRPVLTLGEFFRKSGDNS